MKTLFYVFILLPFLFSCGDDSSDENNTSLEVDSDLLCECFQYETDMLNWVIDGPSDAMTNEIEFERNYAELGKKCEDFERKMERRASDAAKKGEASLNQLINELQQRRESCDAYNDYMDAMNRQRKVIGNELNNKSKKLDRQLNDLDGVNFLLNTSNKRASPAGIISFIADYTIQLTDGSSIIAVFEDSGEGYISEEKDYVSIRTDAGSERTYKYKNDRNGSVRVSLNFFFDGMENEIWRKTYKKYNKNDWRLFNCEGDCEY